VCPWPAASKSRSPAGRLLRLSFLDAKKTLLSATADGVQRWSQESFIGLLRNARFNSPGTVTIIVSVDRVPSLDGQSWGFDEEQLAPRQQPLKRHEEHSWFPNE
jgi:hypothetical protein